MAEYRDLDTVIGEMKRAAIDCWMADQGFYPAWGNEGTYCKWHWAPYQYFRPDEDGSGGGDGVGYNVSCASAFDDIRARIDSIVDMWLDLPDGSKCAVPQGDANAAAAALGTRGASASVELNGEIGTSNGTVHDVVVNRMNGSFKARFLNKYYTQFAKVNSGLGQTAVILEANYAAEAALWPAARADVVKVCEAARDAWAAQADQSSSASTTFQLTIVGAVVGAVSSVVTAGAGTVGAVAGLSGLAVAANTALAAVSADAEVSGDSYESIIGSLESALDKLNETIRTQEAALDDMMNNASATIRGDLASYNLDAFSLDGYTASEGLITIDPSDASIVSLNMGRIESALSTAKSKLGAPPSSSPTSRAWGIGASSSGTHAAASELHSLAARCLELTAAEYRRGHDLFDATVADFLATDADAARTVKNLAADEALSAPFGM